MLLEIVTMTSGWSCDAPVTLWGARRNPPKNRTFAIFLFPPLLNTLFAPKKVLQRYDLRLFISCCWRDVGYSNYMDEVLLASAPKWKSPPKLSNIVPKPKKEDKHACWSCARLRKFPSIFCASYTLGVSASTDGWQFPNVDTALPSSKEAC